jgi:hypothetical protein
MVIKLGYTGEIEPTFYHYLRPISNLDIGLFALGSDDDVLMFATLVLSFKLIEVCIENDYTKLNCHLMSPAQIRGTIEE